MGKWILLAVLILLGLDFLGSWAALLQLKGSLGEPGEVSRRWKHLSDALDNAVTRYIQRRMARAYPSLEREQLRRGQKAARAAQEERPHVFAAGCGFYKLACLFFLGSFLGDVTETVFCRLTAGIWMSRSSVVYGPFSLVWGFGAVLLTAHSLPVPHPQRQLHLPLWNRTGRLRTNTSAPSSPRLVFGTVFWDYSHLPFNLGGRINLLFCFFWGIAAVLWLKLAYPALSRLIERLPMRAGKLLSLGHDRLLLLNAGISSLAMTRYTQRSAGVPAETPLEQRLDERFPDERMEQLYPNAILVD